MVCSIRGLSCWWNGRDKRLLDLWTLGHKGRRTGAGWPRDKQENTALLNHKCVSVLTPKGFAKSVMKKEIIKKRVGKKSPIGKKSKQKKAKSLAKR